MVETECRMDKAEGAPREKKGPKGAIVVNGDLCKECRLCIAHCRKGCIKEGKDYNVKGYRSVRYEENGTCNGCALCALICPEIAIEFYRE